MIDHFRLGPNSTVSLGETQPELYSKIMVSCGANCVVDIKGIARATNQLFIYMNDNATLRMGRGQIIQGSVGIELVEPSTVEIGDDCLWSETKVWTSDMHSIIDNATGLRINHADDIRIGSKVWIGWQSLILKGSVIEDGCIIGARSVITRSTKRAANSLVAGNPARVARRDVSWSLDRIPRD